MIQRIQSIYMLIAVLALVVIPSFIPLWVVEDIRVSIWDMDFVKVVMMVSAALITANIFQFKDRKRQFVINRIAVLLNFIAIGYLLFVFFYEVSGVNKAFDSGIAGFILSVVFLSLANKRIKKDEDLIRSVDRLR